jgi:3-isopropylmalate/(R)-2-methylmalate dehydratase small subunit
MADKSRFLFDIDPLRKEQLILGLDAIDTTLQKELEIKKFEEQHLLDNPWLI